MKRTRWYNNVLSLGIERKRIKLRQRKAERDRFGNATKPNGYRIGLMICLDKIKLPDKDREFCDRLHNLEPGDNATLEDLKGLFKLIGRLIPKERALMIYVADPNEMDDGGSAVLNGEIRKAG